MLITHNRLKICRTLLPPVLPLAINISTIQSAQPTASHSSRRSTPWGPQFILLHDMFVHLARSIPISCHIIQTKVLTTLSPRSLRRQVDSVLLLPFPPPRHVRPLATPPASASNLIRLTISNPMNGSRRSRPLQKGRKLRKSSLVRSSSG